MSNFKAGREKRPSASRVAWAAGRRRRLLVALLVGVACLEAAPDAHAASGDAAATLAYLRADRTMLRADSRQLSAGQAALKSFAVSVSGECPGVASGAPAPYRNELSLEVFYAAGIAFVAPFKQARLRFAVDIERLRWQSRKLTELVRLYARAEREEASLVVPAVCTNLTEWVKGGYGAPPASTARFLRTASSVPAPSEEILGLLRSSVQPGDRGLLRSVKDLEGRTENAVGTAVWEINRHLQEALGLPGAAPSS